jgi:hypothetical protein
MQNVFPVKVTVRRLPASVSEEVFRGLVERASGEARVQYFVAAAGPGRWSRGYLVLPSPRAAEQFHASWNALWVGQDGKAASLSLVEPSPFQKTLPSEEPRSDPLCNSLDSYEPYRQFVQELHKEKVTLPGADVQMERRQAQSAAAGPKQPIISPLIKELTERKLAQLERERAQLARAAPRTVAQRPGGRGAGTQAQGGSAGRGKGTATGEGKKKRGPRRQGRRNKPKKQTE